MPAFAAALPAIRARTKGDLARPGLPRAKVLATVVPLLEKSLIQAVLAVLRWSARELRRAA